MPSLACSQLWAELSQVTDQKVMDVKIDEYSAQVSILWDTLMGLELQLVDQLEVRLTLWLLYCFNPLCPEMI